MIVSAGSLLFVVALATVAHLTLKAGMDQVGRIEGSELLDPIQVVVSILTTPLVLIAMPLYFGSFLAWTVALSRLELSLAYPESTEGGRRVSVLKRQEGAPVLLG